MKIKKKLPLLIGGTTLLGLTVSLPVVLTSCSSEKTTNNETYENQISKYQGLKPITKFNVDETIDLEILAPTNANVDYQYNWYSSVKLNDNDSKVNDNLYFLESTNTPTFTIFSPKHSLNNAIIYCHVIEKQNDNSETTLASNSNDQKSYWTETKLELVDEFSTYNTQIDILANEDLTRSINSEFYLNQESRYVLLSKDSNSSVVLQAKTSVKNPNYQKYIKYQWYLNNNPIQGANNSSLELTNNHDIGAYSVATYLSDDDNISNTTNLDKSQSIKFNVVSTLDLNLSLPIASINNVPVINNELIPMNSLLKLTVNNETKEINKLTDGSLTYTWYKDGKVVGNQNSKSPILELNNVNSETNGEYYCVANISYTNGGSISKRSESIMINVDAPNSIILENSISSVCNVYNGQSINATINAKLTKSSSATNNNLELTYKWFEKSSNSWKQLNNQTNKFELTAEQALKNNGKTFKCVISTNDETNSIQDKEVEFTVNVKNPIANVNVKTNTKTTDLEIGSNAPTFTATVYNVNSSSEYAPNWKYQWVYKNFAGAQWQNIEGQTTSVLNLNNKITELDDGRQIACVIYDDNAYDKQSTAIFSSTTTLSVKNVNLQKVDISSNLQTSRIRLGDDLLLSSEVKTNYNSLPEGYSIKYQWQWTYANQNNWKSIENANSNSLDLSSFKEYGNINFRVIASIVANSKTLKTLTSSSYSLEILPTFNLNVNDKYSVGNNAELNVNLELQNNANSINNSYNPAINYELWFKPNTNSKSSEFKKLSASELKEYKIDISNKNEINFKNIDQSLNGQYYVDVVSNGISLNTNKEVFEVESSKPTFTVNPTITSVEAQMNSSATISVNVSNIKKQNFEGDEYSYEWFANYNGTEVVLPSKYNAKEITINNLNYEWSGIELYCVATNKSTGERAWNQTGIKLVVKTPEIQGSVNNKFDLQVEHKKVIAGEKLTLSVPGWTFGDESQIENSDFVYSYRWQRQESKLTTWRDLNISTTSQSKSLTIDPTLDMDGFKYRVIASVFYKGKKIWTGTSNEYELNVNKNTSFFVVQKSKLDELYEQAKKITKDNVLNNYLEKSNYPTDKNVYFLKYEAILRDILKILDINDESFNCLEEGYMNKDIKGGIDIYVLPVQANGFTLSDTTSGTLTVKEIRLTLRDKNYAWNSLQLLADTDDRISITTNERNESVLTIKNIETGIQIDSLNNQN